MDVNKIWTIGIFTLLTLIIISVIVFPFVKANSPLTEDCSYNSQNNFQGVENNFKIILIHAYNKGCSIFIYNGQKIALPDPVPTLLQTTTITPIPSYCYYNNTEELFSVLLDAKEKNSCVIILWGSMKLKGPLYVEPTSIPYISFPNIRVEDENGILIEGWKCRQEKSNLAICEYITPTPMYRYNSGNGNYIYIPIVVTSTPIIMVTPIIPTVTPTLVPVPTTMIPTVVIPTLTIVILPTEITPTKVIPTPTKIPVPIPTVTPMPVPIPTIVIPTPTVVIPTSTIIPTPTKIVPTPTKIVPTPTVVIPTSTIIPTSIIIPTPTKIVPTPTRIVPTPTRIVPTPTVVIPTPTRIVPTPTRIVPTPTRIVPTPTRIVPTPTSTAPEGCDHTSPIDPDDPEYGYWDEDGYHGWSSQCLCDQYGSGDCEQQ